jgi:hypothetical protein
MTNPTVTCWADRLSANERTELARILARACKRFFNTQAGTLAAMHSQVVASAEMSDLHLDVTERAAPPPRPCIARMHGDDCITPDCTCECHLGEEDAIAVDGPVVECYICGDLNLASDVRRICVGGEWVSECASR